MNQLIAQSVTDVKKANRCLVLRTIAENPMISRGVLAKGTGLSKMTVSNIISDFIEHGIVSETDHDRIANLGPGRKAGLIDLSEDSPCVIGVLITRWNVQAALGDLRGTILCTQTREYPQGIDTDRLIAVTLEAIDAVQVNNRRKILGIGVASMGPVSIKRGIILSPSNFYGMQNVPIVDAIRRHTGLPVYFASDNMAAAQAEKLLGGGRGHANFLFLLIYEGIGCGIIINNRPYAGSRGLGGELGHNSIDFKGPQCPCGNRGCLELYANTRRMLSHIRQQLGPGESMPASDWEGVWRAATSGDERALSAAAEYAEALSFALTNMINTFDPELIYLYQHADHKADELMIRMLKESIQKKALAQNCRSVDIRRASFGEQATLIGTLSLAIASVFSGDLAFA